MKKKQFIITAAVLLSVPLHSAGQEPAYSQTVSGSETIVTIPDPSPPQEGWGVSPMIYGQMLEDCNDRVVYGGVVNKSGEENTAVTEQLRPLQIPVVRWPAGTAIYDYEWRRGVGALRTAQPERIWGGYEYYTFGTDEFINWCRKIGAEPYINIPMGNNNAFTHSLGEALDWVEYVNGPSDSPMGAYRARNGHSEPYGVKYWCLGNENYLGNQFHRSENAAEYAERLHAYASTLKQFYPEISLLGVGHTGNWNTTVLDRCGGEIDFLTLHFYLNANIRDGALESPSVTLFGPEKVEANIRLFGRELEAYNRSAGRQSRPVRFSIDEWNCRHSVFNGSGYAFTRNDARRLYDVAAMASMLNVFIRTSPLVGMANYIFPVNGHGLLRTVGEQDAYASACYHVFDLYRRFLSGRAVGAEVTGPGLKDVNLSDLNVAGDVDPALRGVRRDFCFIDCAATADESGRLVVALVNRSYDSPQQTRISAPPGYEVVEAWTIAHSDVRAENTAAQRSNVEPAQITVRDNTLTLSPCAVAILVLRKTGMKAISADRVSEGLLLTEDADYIISDSLPFEGQGFVDFRNRAHAALILSLVKPGRLLSHYMNHITVNGEPAADGENCQVKPYGRGSIVLPYEKGMPPLVCFSDEDFGGRACTDYSEGDSAGLMKTLDEATLDNAIRSFKLKRGYMVTFALGRAGWGYSRCFIADRADLETNLPAEMAGRVSSYRLFKWNNVHKRGLANQVGYDQNTLLGTSWCYDTSESPDSPLPDTEWIPCIGYDSFEGRFPLGSWASSHLMADIDDSDSSAATPDAVSTALSHWQELMRTGHRLVSPSLPLTGVGGSFLDSVDARGWRCDIANISIENPVGDQASFRALYETCGQRPLWMPDCEAQDSETTALADELNDSPYVERYAFRSTALLEEGQPTPAGEHYANTPDGLSFNTNIQKIPVAVCLDPTDLTASYSKLDGDCLLRWNDPNGDMPDSVVVECRYPGTPGYQPVGKVPVKDAESSSGAAYTYSTTPRKGSNAYRIAVYPAGEPAAHYSSPVTVSSSLAHGTDTFQYGLIRAEDTSTTTADYSERMTGTPAIFMGLCTDNNPRLYPGNLITQAGRTQFNYQVLPWARQSGGTTAMTRSEEIPFLTLREDAEYSFGDLTCEVGSTKVTGDTAVITFRHRFPVGTTPVVLAELRSPSLRSNPMSIRIWDVTNEGFRALLLYEEAVGTPITTGQTLCYMAVTPGLGRVWKQPLHTERTGLQTLSADTVRHTDGADSVRVRQLSTYRTTYSLMNIYAGRGGLCYGNGYTSHAFLTPAGDTLRLCAPLVFGNLQTYRYRAATLLRGRTMPAAAETTSVQVRRQVDGTSNTSDANNVHFGDVLGLVALEHLTTYEDEERVEEYSYPIGRTTRINPPHAIGSGHIQSADRADLLVTDRRILSVSGKPFELYTAGGLRLQQDTPLNPGIYVVKTGNQSLKVLVK